MTKKPILLVLSHGIFGWGEKSAGAHDHRTKDYYYGVRAFLEAEYGSRHDIALTIVAPTVRASESVEARGTDLKKAILNAVDSAPAGTRAHMIAHSMGGLDARWVLVQDGMADRIASLTTIATPHRGTTLGNLAYRLRDFIPHWHGLENLVQKGDRVASWLHRVGIGIDDPLEFFHHLVKNVIVSSSADQVEKGLKALTLDGCDAFNQHLAPAEQAIRERTQRRVVYLAYGGVIGPKPIELLQFSHDLLKTIGTNQEKSRGNDGAVSVWSAHYPWDDADAPASGFYKGTIPFDHFKQINWRIPDTRSDRTLDEDFKRVYRQITEEILSL
jgi:hypothetical protein